MITNTFYEYIQEIQNDIKIKCTMTCFSFILKFIAEVLLWLLECRFKSLDIKKTNT